MTKTQEVTMTNTAHETSQLEFKKQHYFLSILAAKMDIIGLVEINDLLLLFVIILASNYL